MTSIDTTSTRTRRRRIAAMVGAGVLSLAVAGTASAKEIGSGGTPAPTGTTVCSPVSSLTTKGDPRVGELGFASVDINYSVKPCDKNPVTVTVSLYLSADPTQVSYFNTTAPLSANITVPGIRVRTSYIAKVEVFDAATGASIGSASAYAGATPKGV